MSVKPRRGRFIRCAEQREDVLFKIGEPPNRIDILTGRQHLVASKRVAGRPQDILDADRLEAGGALEP